MAFVKPSAVSGGTFFKGADHVSDVAILFEPKSIKKDAEHTYNGKTTTRDEVRADVAYFRTQEALDEGKPTVEKNVIVAYGMVASTLEEALPGTKEGGENGGQVVGLLRKIPTKNGSGYALRDVDEDTFDKVVAYYERREAEIADALANVPDFDA